jgi:hypothetical protein
MFVVNSLPEYVDQHKLDLIAKSVYSAPTIKYLNIQTGVKHSAALNILSTTAPLQANTCGWNANGETSFTQRYLTVGNYKVNMAFCDRDLMQKWANVETLTKAGAEVLPFEEQITSKIVEAVQAQVETLIWNADTKKADAFDGLLTIAKADGTAVSTTATNVYDKVSAVYKAIPVSALDKAVIFVGLDTFRTLKAEITAKNLYHFAPDVE